MNDLTAKLLLPCLGLLAAASVVAQRPVRIVPLRTATQAPQQGTQDPKKAQDPGKASEPAGGANVASGLGADEIRALKATYDGLTPGEQEAMVATYADLGLDLPQLFASLSGGGAAAGGAAPRQEPLAAVVKRLDFSRTPNKVLAARTELGFGDDPLPPEDAPSAALGQWLHRHVLAGEWDALATFLRRRAGVHAEAVYSHVLQSTNRDDPGLLPEEVLAIAEACPGAPTSWQVDALARLLKTAAAKASTRPLLERLRAGTRLFGDDDPVKRQRTARLLAGAGLAFEAYAYLPPLERARADGDVEAMLAHAQYFERRADESGAPPQADAMRRRAWGVYAEVALAGDGTDLADRRAALAKAVDMLPRVPRASATAWLREAFGRPGVASAALEAVALEAAAIDDGKVAADERAQAILTMKEAVETLLEKEDVDLEALRVPLRMLTLSLVSTAEDAVQKQMRERSLSNDTVLVLRALPGARWRAQIEPSLALRAYRAFIGLAVVTDDLDLGLELLTQGVARAGTQGAELADEFLRVWVSRLRPPPDPRANRGFVILGGRQMRNTGLFTRGRKRRNLEVLDRLLGVFGEVAVDGRKLERVVDVFAACHDSTEVFAREDIERVLGPVDALAPAVAARLADTMRRGLSGEWRDADAQREKGVKRTQSEIDSLVEGGYALASDLIERAMDADPRSWRHAQTQLSLAFDRMQFERALGRDPAGYAKARAGLFVAFGDAAERYREALARGEIRPSLDVYFAWFSTALGSSQLSDLTVENLETDAVENAGQFDAIREDVLAMSPDDAQYHIGEFARRAMQQIPGLEPEVKAGVMRAAAALVGDHPAGAPLRRELQLFEDLVGEEVQLRLTLDGADRVGRQPFGAAVSLRSTRQIAKQLGGFDQYLQNGVYMYTPGQPSQRIDYRDRLQRGIERAFDGKVELLSVGMFHSMNPPAEVRVGGQGGWEEKPVAYLVLRAMDESADHLPSLQFDLTVESDKGRVILPVKSNAVMLDAVAERAETVRPLEQLKVHQVVDARALSRGDAEDAGTVRLEITASAQGVVPALDELLVGVSDALPGYTVAADGGIEEKPLTVQGIEELDSFARRNADAGADNYVERSEDGLFRLPTVRTWTVTYERDLSLAQAGDTFTLPKLAEGVEGETTAEHYVDFDLVPVEGPTVPVVPSGGLPAWLGLLAVLVAGALLVGVLRLRGRPGGGDDDLAAVALPAEATPMAVIVTLQRIEREHGDRLGADGVAALRREIDEIEKSWFAADGAGERDLAATLEKWADAVRRGRPGAA